MWKTSISGWPLITSSLAVMFRYIFTVHWNYYVTNFIFLNLVVPLSLSDVLSIPLPCFTASLSPQSMLPYCLLQLNHFFKCSLIILTVCEPIIQDICKSVSRPCPSLRRGMSLKTTAQTSATSTILWKVRADNSMMMETLTHFVRCCFLLTNLPLSLIGCFDKNYRFKYHWDYVIQSTKYRITLFHCKTVYQEHRQQNVRKQWNWFYSFLKHLLHM